MGNANTNHLPAMTKILVVSDDGAPSGYGRISMEVNTRLSKRGYHIIAASVAYDGLLPPTLEGLPLPYWVGSLAGHPNWPEQVIAMIGAIQPDIVMVIQDMTYVEPVRFAPVDWSRYGFVIISPVDGVPIYPRWVKVMKEADAGLTISEFGVEAYRQQGVSVGLCRPGVNPDKFFKLPDAGRAEIRARLGVALEAFVIGVFCQNQGRKAISTMIECFYEFAKDKPTARLLLDMENASPAGWEIRGMLLEPNGWDASKIIFREDAFRAGVTEMRDRYNALDAHMVIAHREGYGLPLAESMACGVATLAMDYCSGTEICGESRGALVKHTDYFEYGTWGGAKDYFVDKTDLVAKLQFLHDHPHERAIIAEKGMAWARQHTWDLATDNVQVVIDRVIALRQKQPMLESPAMQMPQVPIPQPDGLRAETIQLTENAL